MVVDELLEEIVKNNAVNYLVDAGKKFLGKIKDKKTLKKLLVDNSRFFIEHESDADKIIDDIADILCEKNLEALAAELAKDSGYTLKSRLSNGLTNLMSAYEIPHEEAYLYAERILNAVLYELVEAAPEKYDRYFQSDWREEQKKVSGQIIQKLENISNQMRIYSENSMSVYSTDELDIQLKRKTVNPKIGIDFFDIDDDDFINKFNEQKNNEKICIRARCMEEAIYCVVNELWKSEEKRPIFVVKSKEDWDKLTAIGERGNIYIPWFYAEEIVVIENNTNIFIFTDGLPSFSDKEIELRPRTYSTLSLALVRAGMNVSEADALVSETHGLYIPMKRKIFNGAFLKKPEWINGLSDNVKITCMLVGQWTDAEGDKAVIEELSKLEYNEFIKQVRKYSYDEEPFVHIVKNGSEREYYLASVQNTWEYLDISTDSKIWKTFTKVCVDVMIETESLFTYSYVEKFEAQYKGEKLFWSGNIRKGMLNALLMKGCIKDNWRSQKIMDSVVTEIIEHVNNEKQWKYISKFFTELCELSPSVILKRLENEWSNPTGLLSLFANQSDNIMFERNSYIDILWGVDTLLVQRKYAKKAFEWLLRVDDMCYRYQSNSPKDSIKKVICSWINLSAFRTVDEKSGAAKMALTYDKNGWDHVYKALPSGNSSIIGSIVKPHYREYVTTESVLLSDLKDTMDQYMKLLIKEANFKPERWEALLDIAEDIPDINKDSLIDNMLYEVTQMSDAERIHIKNYLRRKIYKNRYFNTAKWALPENVIKQYEKLLDEIHTEEPEYEYEYLFIQKNDGILLNPVPYGEDDRRKENKKASEQLIKTKLEEFRQKNFSIARLASICAKEKWTTLGSWLGIYFSDDYDENILLILYKAQEHRKLMAIDYCRELAVRGVDIYSHISKLQDKIKLDDEFIVQIYRLESCFSGENIPKINDAPEHIKHMFWENAEGYMTDKYIWALKECRKYGTVEAYLMMLYGAVKEKGFTKAQIYDYFIEIKDMENIKSVAELPYYLKELLSILQDEYIDDDEKCNVLASIEIRYSGVLEWNDMKAFQKSMKASPEAYAELVSLLFKKDRVNGNVGNKESKEIEEYEKISEATTTDNAEMLPKEKNKEENEEKNRYIEAVYHIYEKAKFCPAEKCGKVNTTEIKEWIEHFRELLKKNGQIDSFSYHMGRLLANSPAGEDGYYPCEAVREMLEKYADEDMIDQYVNAIYYGRGIYTPTQGREEKNMAERYKENADYLSTRYTKAADIYYRLYDVYCDEAKWQRERAENGR